MVSDFYDSEKFKTVPLDEPNLGVFTPNGVAANRFGEPIKAETLEEKYKRQNEQEAEFLKSLSLLGRKISIAIPTYQRLEMLFESFGEIYYDDRISEIVIVDDESDLELFEKIRERAFNLPKIKLYRNVKNRDCYENKYTAISFCTNEWCILLDSDNIIHKDYIDKIFSIEWDKDTAYMPSFAYPSFDYKELSGFTLSKENIAEMIKFRMCGTMLNCMNYFINCGEYMRIWQPDINPHTADSILQNYNWFAAGNKMLVVPGLQYFHRVHDGSHYQQNVHKTGNLYTEVLDKIKLLK